MNRILSAVLILVCVPLLAQEPPPAPDSRAVYTAELEAGLDDVWDAFTTNEGLRMWMAPLVEIDLAVGGTIRSSYDPGGTLGDESTITNTILAYDPGRMLALKATGYPEGFPFARAARETWSVFYFDALSPSKTAVTIVGLGYTDREDSRKMREFFEPANAELLRRLGVALQAKRPPAPSPAN